MPGFYDPSYGVPGPGGPPGAAGANGRTLLSGAVAPVPGLGADGDFYIDTVAHYLYGPKAAGAWPAGTSLVGPAGSPIAGVDSGAAAPDPGVVGDNWIRLNTAAAAGGHMAWVLIGGVLYAAAPVSEVPL